MQSVLCEQLNIMCYVYAMGYVYESSPDGKFNMLLNIVCVSLHYDIHAASTCIVR